MNENNNGSFWPSYVDIMTTLFAIMLVLFAVSFSRFKIKNNQLQELVDEYEDIITVYSTVSSIDSTRFFGYNAEYFMGHRTKRFFQWSGKMGERF